MDENQTPITTNIDNETPVLRKEDLIDILEALFKFSQESHNAFVRKQDGLYVFDFYDLFQNHINDATIHFTSQETAILSQFTLVNDILHYKNEPVIVRVSDEANNAIIVKPDGIYIADLSQTLTGHINDNERHITDLERQAWNNMLNLSKKYTDEVLEALVVYDYQFVNDLPTNEASIKYNVIYCLKQTMPDSGEVYYIKYLYREHKWIPMDITNESYKLFARKEYVDNNFVQKTDSTVHSHSNKQTLDKFSERNGRLLYNNLDILDIMQISDDPRNAIYRGSDNKLYVKDLSTELAAIARNTTLSKVVLLEQDCNEAGIYELEEDINEFNFLMIHYYLMPDDETIAPYDAKMEMVDVDSLNELYNNHIDYILEHDYGISTYNTKIRFNGQNRMQVTYYNHVCIYKIIGIH